jgi:AraC-like DNA-binding protein
MSLPKKKLENSLIDSLEEATELLRRVPVAAWTWWFGGSLPFIVTLLHFWNDMSRSASAWDKVGTDAFVLVLLFVFMKVCHACFGDHLLRQLRDEEVAPPLSFRGKVRLVSSQALIHAFTPWLLPLALMAMLPFSWAYASFHNVSILSLQVLREGGRTRDILKLAVRQSHYRAKQNHGLMLILLPDAVQALTGLSPADWVNRFEPVEAVCGADWQALCQAVLAAADDDARVALIEAFLLPRWQTARPPAAAPGLFRLQDWARGLALRAASSGAGRSLRQAERRIKGWAGLPMRELRGLGRAEQAFFRTLAQGDEPVRWTDVAADTGYADQSHLCRETRRVTGFAPAELRHRIAEDESFWIYRIWA